ncbi:Probable RNA-directed DNA polymerase from transposon X-element [Eumeta japonica]|uniref:Probable RNA-directed DNA polymerase from transposon X-element n=1 Tax=Eumeta variegata TaxID=151549 RepID=A0A4C1XVK8_EUMVA|nr:Probable RNA-directed DNA polymerase from transposon X-element [Eumeta japonica]
MGPPDGGRPNPRKITDWKECRPRSKNRHSALNSIPDNIRTTDEIDSAIGALTNHIRTVVENASGRFRHPRIVGSSRLTSRTDKSKEQSFAPREHIPLQNIDPARALQREVKARVQEFEMSVGATSWRKLGRHTKRSGRSPKRSKRRVYTYSPLKRLDGSTALDDAEVADRIEEEVLQKTSLEPRDDLTPVSLSEVQLLVRSLKTRKAPGLDGISNKAIKCFPQQLLSLLVAIFNACLQNCHFPPVWKEAEVIGIHKPGKPRDLPASYRPISLLSGLAKLSRVLKTRLSDHLFGKVLSLTNSSVFAPPSCPQQVLRVVEYISEGFKINKKP